MSKYTDKNLEKELKRFGDLLISLNLTIEQVTKINELMIESVSANTMIEIAKKMTEKEVDKWNAFLKTNPNDAQQLIVLDEYCKIKFNKKISDLHAEELLNSLISFQNYIKDTNENLEYLKQFKDEKVELLVKDLKQNYKRKYLDNLNKISK